MGNRIGLKPVQAERMPTGNYNYAKYRPREAKFPFEQYGLILEKAKNKEDSTEQLQGAKSASDRFPNIRENVMRSFSVYDPKKEHSRRKYKTLSDALKSTGLPNNIKHKYMLTRNHKETTEEPRSAASGYREGQSVDAESVMSDSRVVTEQD